MIPVTSTYGEIPPTLQVKVGNAEWEANGLDPQLTDLYCVVEMELTDSTFAPWAQTEGLYYGVASSAATSSRTARSPTASTSIPSSPAAGPTAPSPS